MSENYQAGPYPASQLATVDEIAELLRLQPETVRQMAREGRLPSRKLGKAWRFNPAEVQLWLENQGKKSKEEPADADHVAELTLPLYDVQPQRTNGTSFKDPAFTENRGEPVHRWVPWVAGFSSGFVADCLQEYLPSGDPAKYLVMDPFAGVGTTLVEAYKHGHNTIGFEINPWAALASRAKLEAMDVSVKVLEAFIKAFQAFMEEMVNSGEPPDPSIAPQAFRSRIPFFSPRVESQVLWALKFIEVIHDQKLKDLFLVAFGSVMVRFSNYSYEPSLGSRPGSGKPLIEDANVTGIICAKLQEIVVDCRVIQASTAKGNSPVRCEVFQDTIFNAKKYLPCNSADLAVTSPPYLNNYHYIRNTRPHLFWLKFIEAVSDLRAIEHANIGKYWQTVRDGAPVNLDFKMPALEVLIKELRGLNNEKGIYGGSGWANYAAQYFNDTNRFCETMQYLLKPGGRLVVVVGNSILQGMEFKVDEFYARIGETHGMKREAIHMLRTKRVGNSIIRSSVRNAAGEKASLYEVAVILRKE